MRLTLHFIFFVCKHFHITQWIDRTACFLNFFLPGVSPVGTSTHNAFYILCYPLEELFCLIKSGSFILSFVKAFHKHTLDCTPSTPRPTSYGVESRSLLSGRSSFFFLCFSRFANLASMVLRSRVMFFTLLKSQHKYKNKPKRKEPTKNTKYKLPMLGTLGPRLSVSYVIAVVRCRP